MAYLQDCVLDPGHSVRASMLKVTAAVASRPATSANVPSGHSIGHAEAIAPRRPVSWTQDTALLQVNHPRVRLLAQRLTQLHGDETERILACFDYVKRMPFVWMSLPYTTTSFDVIGRGCGDAHTKSTLFVGLLRSLGIPARIRVLTVDPKQRTDTLPGRPEHLEHVVTQVYRQDRGWVSVDSYAMDPALSVRSFLQHAREKGTSRNDLHLQGSNWWNGVDDSLMFVDRSTDATPVLIDHGCFHDVQQFHTKVCAQDSHRSGFLATFIANSRLRKFRVASHASLFAEK